MNSAQGSGQTVELRQIQEALGPMIGDLLDGYSALATRLETAVRGCGGCASFDQRWFGDLPSCAPKQVASSAAPRGKADELCERARAVRAADGLARAAARAAARAVAADGASAARVVANGQLLRAAVAAGRLPLRAAAAARAAPRGRRAAAAAAAARRCSAARWRRGAASSASASACCSARARAASRRSPP
ncbi:hypothetical protein FGB62_43g114 [Gracilaria domingensis]|nr:hypothetical protein FGB62_43g114 [Gracilaria domingensis]